MGVKDAGGGIEVVGEGVHNRKMLVITTPWAGAAGGTVDAKAIHAPGELGMMGGKEG